jgi:hypothetical protein
MVLGVSLEMIGATEATQAAWSISVSNDLVP